MNRQKAKLYKTAKALISCGVFRAGEFVSVIYDFTANDGTNWFLIDSTENGKLAYAVAYPEQHLTEFCL